MRSDRALSLTVKAGHAVLQLAYLPLREKTHAFAREVIRLVASEYDRAQEFPWPVLEAAARHGFYGWELYASWP